MTLPPNRLRVRYLLSRRQLEEVLLCAFFGLVLGLWALVNLPR